MRLIVGKTNPAIAAGLHLINFRHCFCHDPRYFSIVILVQSAWVQAEGVIFKASHKRRFAVQQLIPQFLGRAVFWAQADQSCGQVAFGKCPPPNTGNILAIFDFTGKPRRVERGREAEADLH